MTQIKDKKNRYSKRRYDKIFKYHKRRWKDESKCQQHIFDSGEIGKFYHCGNCGKILYISFTPFLFEKRDLLYANKQLQEIDEAIIKLTEYREKLINHTK